MMVLMQAVPVEAEGQVVFAACNEDIIGRQFPTFAGDVLKLERGAGERVKAPEAFDGAGDHVGGRISEVWAWAVSAQARLLG